MLNILSAIAAIWGLIKGFFSVVKEVTTMFQKYFAKKADEKLGKDLEEAKNAKTVEEKARAACKIQKDIDPSATCDDGSRR